MRTSSKVKVQAKTLDKAIEMAAGELGVESDLVEYEVISQVNGGILSFLGSKRIEISAWSIGAARGNSSGRPSRPRRPARTESDEPRVELSESEVKALVADLKDFCAGICKFIVGEDVAVAAHVADGRLVIDIDNDEMASQLSKNSKLAESMEHVLRKKPRHLKRELPFRIFIDARGLRIDREKELIEMAQDLSDKVHEKQKPIVLNYKSSYDRKIIHMALDKNEKVYTKSIGSGANRKLMILPARDEQSAEA
jgi:spoIIIJ-associated protein